MRPRGSVDGGFADQGEENIGEVFEAGLLPEGGHCAFGDQSAVVEQTDAVAEGFGFVEMENEEEGKTAIEKLNEKDFDGRQLTVNEARPRAPRPAGGGGYGGGGGGGGYSGR